MCYCHSGPLWYSHMSPQHKELNNRNVKGLCSPTEVWVYRHQLRGYLWFLLWNSLFLETTAHETWSSLCEFAPMCSAASWESQPLWSLKRFEKFNRWVCVCMVRLYSRKKGFLQHCVHTVYLLYAIIMCEVFYMFVIVSSVSPHVRPLTANLNDSSRFCLM